MENEKNMSVHITFLLFPDLLIPISLPAKLWRPLMILLIRAILMPDLLCSCKSILWFGWAADNLCQGPCREI